MSGERRERFEERTGKGGVSTTIFSACSPFAQALMTILAYPRQEWRPHPFRVWYFCWQPGVCLARPTAASFSPRFPTPRPPAELPTSSATVKAYFGWLHQRGVRFDGFHYLLMGGLPFLSGAQLIADDRQGRVWAGGGQGLAFRVDAAHWKMVVEREVTALAASPAGGWFVADGALKPNTDEAEPRSFPDAHPTGLLVVDRQGSVWFPCAVNICFLSSLI